MAVINPATCQFTPIIPGEQKKCVFITIAAATAADTLLAQFNDIDSIEKLISAHCNSIAAIIVKPDLTTLGKIIGGGMQIARRQR